MVSSAGEAGPAGPAGPRGAAGAAGPAGGAAGADPAVQLGGLVDQALTSGDPTGWFEPLYAAAERGEAVVPWDRGYPHWLLAEWAQRHGGEGAGRRAVVVGCGPGADAELIAGRGFTTTAFDISPSAIGAARRRFPGTSVDYQVADLLDPPPAWREAFDLVVESQTIQALPDPPRRDAIAQVAGLVAAGGRLIVISLARDEEQDPPRWPPWPITRAELGGFAGAGLLPVRIGNVGGDGRQPPGRWWVAEFRRPAQPVLPARPATQGQDCWPARC